MVSVGGWLIVIGSLIFFLGAAYGVPRVFTVRGADDRLALLQTREDAWRSAQWLYAAGPLLAAVGVVVLAAGWPGSAGVMAGAAGAALFLGAVLWSVTCARRGRNIEKFARSQLPVGPWLGYVCLTLAGLAILGFACLAMAVWVAILLWASAAAFTVLFVATRDIPPFVFYLVLAVVGVWVVVAAPH